MHISVHSVPVTKIDLITKDSAQYKHLWSSVSPAHSLFAFDIFVLWVLCIKITALLKLCKNRLCSVSRCRRLNIKTGFPSSTANTGVVAGWGRVQGEIRSVSFLSLYSSKGKTSVSLTPIVSEVKPVTGSWKAEDLTWEEKEKCSGGWQIISGEFLGRAMHEHRVRKKIKERASTCAPLTEINIKIFGLADWGRSLNKGLLWDFNRKGEAGNMRFNLWSQSTFSLSALGSSAGKCIVVSLEKIVLQREKKKQNMRYGEICKIDPCGLFDWCSFHFS